MHKLRPIAIHLPQFHPFPENDMWWGKGFTEWTNVTKAKPLFKNHYQPHLPADLGFYDLRLEDSRIAQANLARQYGIYGFCYYHYWFNEKRLMQAPLNRLLASGEPDFPFMLCWANENWTRRWDGLEHELLLKQTYSEDDDLKHIRFLCEHFFADSRYIRVDGKPFIVIYRPGLFPDIKRTIELWRSESVRLGIGDLHIGFMSHFSFEKDFKEIGFDCCIEFQPNPANLPPRKSPPLLDLIRMKLKLGESPFIKNTVYNYSEFVDLAIKNTKIEKYTYPGIMPGWDNSPRKSAGAYIFEDASPNHYERWLKKIKEVHKNQNTFLFINAWNEWAEGAHLEPCRKWGNDFLSATNRVLHNA